VPLWAWTPASNNAKQVIYANDSAVIDVGRATSGAVLKLAECANASEFAAKQCARGTIDKSADPIGTACAALATAVERIASKIVPWAVN
jgi:Asp/Glu/hydantoin racemase